MMNVHAVHLKSHIHHKKIDVVIIIHVLSTVIFSVLTIFLNPILKISRDSKIKRLQCVT